MADYQLQYEGPDIDRRLNLAGTAIQPEAGRGLYPDVDAEKLEGIEDGAQVNKVESISRNGEAIVPDENKNYDIDVPTKVSDLNNDKEYQTRRELEFAIRDFITASVDNLVNYYKKNETYTQDEVNQIVATIKQFEYILVSELPTASKSTMGKIYLVPAEEPGAKNVKDEYITIDNGPWAPTRYTWESIGSTAINLSNYYTKEQTQQRINIALLEYTKTADLLEMLAGKVGEAPDDGGQYVRQNKDWKPIDVPRHPYLSLERLRHYLYRVTFDNLPEDNGEGLPALGGCSSYVQNGKLYTNLDWDYNNTASFIVRTRDFEGQSFIGGMTDGNLNDEQIAQLPYRMHRGENNYGIRLAAHILYNDWSWTGCGDKSINLTRLPFLVLTRVKSMATLASDLDGVLNNLYCPEGLAAMGYLLQLIVTDGTTIYAIIPPTSEGRSYEVLDITSCPKLTNFRPVRRDEVSRFDADIQAHPTGIERYNMMPCPLEDLRFTKAYESASRLSEFIGLRGTDKDSSDAELLAIYNDARVIYLERKRDGKTWQTMESAVYGDRLEELYIQENWEDNCIAGGITKAYVDSEIARVENEIPTKVSELENDADYISDAPSNEEIYGRENRQWKAAAYKEDVEWGDF